MYICILILIMILFRANASSEITGFLHPVHTKINIREHVTNVKSFACSCQGNKIKRLVTGTMRIIVVFINFKHHVWLSYMNISIMILK